MSTNQQRAQQLLSIQRQATVSSPSSQTNGNSSRPAATGETQWEGPREQRTNGRTREKGLRDSGASTSPSTVHVTSRLWAAYAACFGEHSGQKAMVLRNPQHNSRKHAASQRIVHAIPLLDMPYAPPARTSMLHASKHSKNDANQFSRPLKKRERQRNNNKKQNLRVKQTSQRTNQSSENSATHHMAFAKLIPNSDPVSVGHALASLDIARGKHGSAIGTREAVRRQCTPLYKQR